MGQQSSIETKFLVNHIDASSENNSSLTEPKELVNHVDTGTANDPSIKLDLSVTDSGFLFSSNDGSCNKIKLLWEYAQTHGEIFYITISHRPHIDLSWSIDGSNLSNAGSSAPYRIYIKVDRLGKDRMIWALLFDPKRTGPRIDMYLFKEWVTIPTISKIILSEDGNSFTVATYSNNSNI